MTGALIAVLVVIIPVILFPAAFIWYVNLGGIIQAVRETREARKQMAATEKVKA